MSAAPPVDNGNTFNDGPRNFSGSNFESRRLAGAGSDRVSEGVNIRRRVALAGAFVFWTKELACRPGLASPPLAPDEIRDA